MTGYNYIDLFHGIGGFALGAYWAGMKFENHFCSDIEPYTQKLYKLRFPESIQLGDITKIDTEELKQYGNKWIITGGFPCQDISIAGKGAGITPERGLVFGLNIGDLLTIYDRTSQSWKMSECLFTGDYEKYLEVLPKSGIMLNGRIYEQATWVHRIKENVSGLWLIPTVIQIKPRSETALEKKIQKRLATGRRTSPPGTLMEQVISGCSAQDMKVKMWPTPDCSDRRSMKSKQQGLSNAVKMFPTITANDAKNSITESQRGRGTLTDAMIDEKQNTPDGQLNPQFVEKMMGYPVGWTGLKDSEMQLSLK